MPGTAEIAAAITRTQVQNRLSKVVEDTNIKVAHAMSDLFGTSGQRMPKALCVGVHKILVIIYHVLMDGTFYDESRYARHDAREEAREKQRALAALARLGYIVDYPVKTHTTKTLWKGGWGQLGW